MNMLNELSSFFYVAAALGSFLWLWRFLSGRTFPRYKFGLIFESVFFIWVVSNIDVYFEKVSEGFLGAGLGVIFAVVLHVVWDNEFDVENVENVENSGSSNPR